MERRVLIAALLSFLVLYGYQALFVPPQQPPAQVTVPSEDPAAGAPSTLQPALLPNPQENGEVDGVPPALAAELTSTQAGDAPAPVTTDTAAREITVTNGVVEAVLSNQGGRIVHWRLLDHLDENGDPLDLIPTSTAGNQPTPFLLDLGDADLTARATNALYAVTGATGATGRVDVSGAPVAVQFEFEDAGGLVVRKSLTFTPDSYLVRFSASATNAGQVLNPGVRWGPGLSAAGASTSGGGFFGSRAGRPEAIYFQNDDVERVAFDNLAEAASAQGVFRFAGIVDHYFVAAAIDIEDARLDYEAAALTDETGIERPFIDLTFQMAQPPEDLQFYFGPKQFDLLQSVNADFVRTIDFGFFAWLVVPLLSALNWIHDILGNYGWSIVVLTLFINLLIFPLRHKSMVSMRKMQGLQPQLKAIQDRYKALKVTDPARQKMNTEIMNLYREKKVNPASGCVPMLLTMPVLLAFYSLLQYSIELRDAPFTLWIQDLSLKDPYYVTPLLMGASMFWQQKLTPPTADPTQQRVMMLMPVLFTGMFLNFPSGLVIYWFTSQVWAIGQQYFTNWMIGPPNITAPRPPAERQMKRVGKGRSPGAEAGDQQG